MAKNNFWESLKVELTPELSESARHFDQEYSELIEKLSEQAYSQLKNFAQSCKPVPKESSSLVVTISSCMIDKKCNFWARVTGEYPNTPVFIIDDLLLFRISDGFMMQKEKTLEINKWYAANEIFDTAQIFSRIHNKQFGLHEIFGDSYECEIPIEW